ncbi:MAG: SseB family protein [Lachnospiraceae bacterium]|nr:SseB family protein [Lachnospiraceae bacterium]
MAKNNFFFGRKQMPENVQEQVKKEVEKQTEKKSGKRRRYTLLVEEVVESARMQGVMVIGNLHGRIREDDTMYLYQPGKPVREVKVVGIELGPREIVDTAKNQQVGLGLDIEDVNEVSRFAVLSSVKPAEGELANLIIENPRLFGLMMEYKRLYQNTAYMDELLYELCHAKFVVPLYMDRPPIPQADGSAEFSKDAFVGFRSLKKPGDDNEVVFPAFTDELATASWKDAFQEGQPKRFATMQLPHLLVEVRRGHAGLVINPFGPVPVYFPKELLDQVEKSTVFFERYVMPGLVPKEEPKED